MTPSILIVCRYLTS
uniref:Uncharacterized protein n=1 Tax=Anguilla anguilla TaxID=7936 RepID=A0A0E9RNW3_ANGAN